MSVRLDEDTQRRLEEYASETGRSPSQAVRQALDEFLAKRPKTSRRSLGHKLRGIGALGCLEDAPSDLSTNKKYMKGFGK